MALLSTQAASGAGTVLAYTAASAGGDKCEASADVALRVKNGSGASVTVTVASQVQCNQGGTHNLSVVVAAGQEAVIGPFPPQRFASPVDGLVAITYSAVTSVTVAVERI